MSGMPERIVLSRSYVLKALSSCGLKHKVCESQGQLPVLRLQSLANRDQNGFFVRPTIPWMPMPARLRAPHP